MEQQGIRIHRSETPAEAGDLDALIRDLDEQVGAVLTSGYEYPGRYSRWDIGYASPILVLEARGLTLTISAPGPRGEVLLPAIAAHLEADGLRVELSGKTIVCLVPHSAEPVFEEDRSRRPSAFTAIRSLLRLLHAPAEPHLGLYGAFGYDMLFQFEPIDLRLERPANQRDIVLHLPDRLLVIDQQKHTSTWYSYEFEADGKSTEGLARQPVNAPKTEPAPLPERMPSGAYAEIVHKAKEYFARGDLYEVVPGQPFYARSAVNSEFFNRLRHQNPAPYGFYLNLGEDQLVGASPEMFVRVDGRRVETCPISGTLPRGLDAIGDAEQIRALLNSAKDEAELTMCTDVDRNDKARVCVPGSVRVIGRRQIEMYSRLIHTVDHVEGILREDRDALDAFLTHMWAVTITGAPKKWATQFIEDHEEAPRGWYGGAVGVLNVNGNINTGLTLRTAQIRDQVALVRAGATLLYDSVPELEEAETELKASALLRALNPDSADDEAHEHMVMSGHVPKVLVVDHEDSFTLNLADYFRQAGAEVTTVRWGFRDHVLDDFAPDLVVLSPGPSNPQHFGMSGLLDRLYGLGLPVFGVCLGLQGIVEHAGGKLHQLAEPRHGKPSHITTHKGTLFPVETDELTVGRYHSLHAVETEVPEVLRVTATTDGGVVMAIEHRELPVWAVQFHPESILSFGGDGGLTLVQRVMNAVAQWQQNPVAEGV